VATFASHFQAMAKSTESQQSSNLLLDLRSGDEKIVLKAISKVRSQGNEKVIDPMLVIIDKNDMPEAARQAHSMLGELKISAAADLLIDRALKGDYPNLCKDMIYFIWHSGLQPNDRVDDIIRIAIAGDFEVALECYTLIDTLDGPFKEEVLLEAMVLLKEYMLANTKNDKFNLVASIFECVKTFDSQLLG
jgi:hypothetical protein